MSILANLLKPVNAYLARRKKELREAKIATEKRLEQHRKSCIQAYRAKALRIRSNRPGNNTLAGIPAEWV